MTRTHQPLDRFIQTVECALDHFADGDWLGAQSPLAAPYFLGNVLDGYPDNETPAGRGRALRHVLLDAAQELTADQQELLNVVFFRRNPHLNNAGLALQLDCSQATFYRRRTNALEAIAQVISQRMLPPLRPETPCARTLVGRDQLLRSCLQILGESQSVALIGPGGVGKTTLGIAVMEAWDRSRTFWFTVRPGLNDQLSSLVFALGYFLRGLGAANTWRQLVADRGKLDLDSALGLIRHDLAALKSVPPLLCVDEIDLLRSELNEHAQIIHLLEELVGLAPLLLLGQQLLIEPNQVHLISRFTPAEVDMLLAQAALPTVTPTEQQQLYQVTHGNPALVTLLITLWRTGESIATALAQIGSTPSVELLLNRIWKRLSENECAMLMALAVFRTFAPQDGWPASQALIDQLVARELLTKDERGGIALLPSIREFVYQRTPADLKIACHGAAAQIRELRGEYTAAAYHYLAAHQPAMAVWVWFNHRTQEIERGRATAARTLFKTVAFGDLPDDEDRRALALLRAELYKLVGAAEEAESELQAVTWPRTHPITPYAQQLHGDVLEVQEGRYAQALDRYREGLHLLGGAAQLREVDLLIRQGYVYLVHLRDLPRAREEALLARLNAEEFCGTVEEEAGNYAAARTHYEMALAIAKSQENNLRLLARVHSHLGRLTWRQGDAATAIEHLEQAIQGEEMRGNVVGILHARVNLSGAYIIAGRYGEALTQAQAGLTIAEALRHSYLIAGLASNAGEACYYLKQMDLAEQYVIQSLQQEEDAHRPYALTVLGLVQQAQKRFGLAERSLRSALESAQTIRDKYAEAAAWRALARCYRGQQNMNQTLFALEAALRLYRELGLSQEAAELQTELEQP